MEINRPGVHKFRVVNNSTFDITITGTYTVSITFPEATTWFSQKSSGVGTTWNSTYLSSLYCPNMSTVGCNDCSNGIICANIPWYTISDQSGHINKWGCSACSLGMIFRNLGATTTVAREDFRTGTISNLSADPFTIAMANINWPTITTSSSKYVITSHKESYSPVYPYWDRIANSFGLNAYKVSINSTDAAEIADILAYYIDANPEGILVRISGSHSLVFTDTTHTISATFNPEEYEVIKLTSLNEEYVLKTELEQEQALSSRALFATTSTDYDSKFICYDPVTTDITKGCNVPYDDSWTAGYYGGIDLVNYIYYFD